MEIWALLVMLLLPADLGDYWGTPVNTEAGEVQAMDDGFPIPPK